MKITGVRIDRHTVKFEPIYHREARSITPLSIYPEYNNDDLLGGKPLFEQPQPGTQRAMFLVITTDEGIEGQYGPVENRSELLTIMDGIAPHIIGRNPLHTRMIWDINSRYDRHCRSGIMMMAISAVDIALWDLKGKILGLPIYQLLGGGRTKIKPYVSMLDFSLKPDRVRQRAMEIKAMGIGAQKWFFRYGPADGVTGMRKNLELAYTLRDTLGTDYELMFDCWMGWDLRYARSIFRELEQVAPAWVEEVLRPHMAEAYLKLREDTTIPLSAGEHLYTRMEVNQYLKDHVFDVMQSDPAWCGGITEALRIADLCEMYGVAFIPHGHSLMPAMHVVASMPLDICPYCEYLLNFMEKKNSFFQQRSLTKDGFFLINNTPGLGEELDMERLICTDTVREFSF